MGGDCAIIARKSFNGHSHHAFNDSELPQHVYFDATLAYSMLQLLITSEQITNLSVSYQKKNMFQQRKRQLHRHTMHLTILNCRSTFILKQL